MANSARSFQHHGVALAFCRASENLRRPISAFIVDVRFASGSMACIVRTFFINWINSAEKLLLLGSWLPPVRRSWPPVLSPNFLREHVQITLLLLFKCLFLAAMRQWPLFIPLGGERVTGIHAERREM